MRISTVLGGKGHLVVTVRPNDTVNDLLLILKEYNIGAAVVSDDGTVALGVASERDVVRNLVTQGTGLLDYPVSFIMTPIKVVCSGSSSVEEVMALMTSGRVRHVPVYTEEQTLEGIVSIGDIVKSYIDHLEYERRSLIAYVTS